ncbi:response regulator [Fulvivirga maritima]|uniref:response regulator n=1 Tax=Fulvivirga maritima TaxID=2904247 RepID=UPI001F18654B|nr:response regulator [Fulvivirga maritima]UII28023.1 response regulator [Fulvivirga maritima]
MKSKRILIIHQDEETRREMHSILSHFDFDLMYATDGLHGLYAAKENQPDLIITDIDIAVLNGLDMVDMLRNEESTKDISIICLHGEMDLNYIRSARELEASAFLIKPYLDNSLIYAVKKSLGETDLKVNKERRPLRYEECRAQQLAFINYA